MRKPFLQPQSPNSSTQRTVLSVSQLNRKAKSLMESELGTIWLEGEISNFIQAASAHWYFTLKDSNAQIKCAIFKFKNRFINFLPVEGDKVIIKGKVSLYEARGDYQMIADYMEPSGLGALQQQLNALIKKLENEQLFEQVHKQSLPFLPKAIGVITSPTGAAVHDVIAVLERRCPMIPIIIYPTQVQGKMASRDINHALETAMSRKECDVLIITRGGGSLEDLWCFNDEVLANKIFQCSIPIVAAIGHEVDVTITELVSDLRAATPSAAAELVSPDQQSLWQKLDNLTQDLNDYTSAAIYQLQNKLNIAALKLSDPVQLITSGKYRLDKLKHKIELSYISQLKKQQIRIDSASKLLETFHPKEKLVKNKHRLETNIQKMQTAMNVQIRKEHNKLSILVGELNALSPLSTISRGYSITRDAQSKKIISKVTQTRTGQTVNILLSDGEVNSQII